MLVQDYHFALLPRMIRDAAARTRPSSRSGTSPGRIPRRSRICPWREELLDGLLGSSILGFHTQFHCNNFVDTVDRLLEARVDRETFTVSYRGQPTAVKRYPISIEWPPAQARDADSRCAECRARSARAATALPATASRSASASTASTTPRESSSASAPSSGCSSSSREWIGRFTLRPDRRADALAHRASIRSYEARVRALAAEINARFAGGELPADHPARRAPRAATRCTSTIAPPTCASCRSLHDGMNLVAKEFVAARDDERGVLILSQFTGASRELPEALIVNPYDTDQCAAALHLALTHAGGRAARPHAHHARPGPRVQRLPLGGAHAARCGRDAPARPAHRACRRDGRPLRREVP